MAYMFTLAQHPQTNESVLVVGSTPQPWNAPDVLSLLRTIKRGFPGLFQQVQCELVLPENISELQLPDSIGDS
jgi:hypothetical protein